LMNSRVHGSEVAFGELGCDRVVERRVPRILIGGLGMGFTLAAALSKLGPDAEVIVAELVPEVVAWNRGVLGELAKFPLRDPRVKVRTADVAELLREGQGDYDAILLDVDNGPEALPDSGNDWLYGRAGLAVAQRALSADGVLAVWSAGSDPAFARRLRAAGYEVDEVEVRASGYRRGARHTIWFARCVS
jgi:spermidine synthase